MISEGFDGLTLVSRSSVVWPVPAIQSSYSDANSARTFASAACAARISSGAVKALTGSFLNAASRRDTAGVVIVLSSFSFNWQAASSIPYGRGSESASRPCSAASRLTFDNATAAIDQLSGFVGYAQSFFIELAA